MPLYTPPMRDLQFVLHELLHVTDELKAMPRHAEMDVETINAVLEEGGKFASEVLAPLNQPGDEQGSSSISTTTRSRHRMVFKDAYAKYVEGGWPARVVIRSSAGRAADRVNQCIFEMLNSANQAWAMYPA